MTDVKIITPGLSARIAELYHLDKEDLQEQSKLYPNDPIYRGFKLDPSIRVIEAEYNLKYETMSFDPTKQKEFGAATYKRTKQILKNPHLSEDQDALNIYADIICPSRADFRYEIEGAMLNKLIKSKFKRTFRALDYDDFLAFFDRLERLGLLTLFEHHIEQVSPERSLLPNKILRARHSRWIEVRKKNVSPLEARENKPELLPDTPEPYSFPEELKSKLIPVDSVVKWGDGDPMLSTEAGDVEAEHKLKPEYRIQKVCHVLFDKIGIEVRCIDKIYYVGDEYVIDLKTTQGGRSQILVSDYRDVYVIKDEDFSEAHLPFYRSPDPTTERDENITFLIDRVDVWKTNCPRDTEDYKDIERRLTHWLLSPTEQIKPQNKHKVAWANKGRMLINTLVATIVRTGEMPKTQDQETFRYGELSVGSKVQASPSRAYFALRNRSIKHFADQGDVVSLRSLWDSIVVEEPALESFLNGQPVEDLDVLIEGCRKIIENTGLVPCEANNQALTQQKITIAGHGLEACNAALKYGVFQGGGRHLSDEVLVETSPTLDALVVRAGLAQWQGNALIPCS